jgi:chain length determinant protein tyrosine kinase EpsG
MVTVIKESRRERAAPRNEALIGELLLSAGTLTEQDVDRVVTVQQKSGLRFGEVAIELGLLREVDLYRALSRQFDFPYVIAGESSLDPSLYAAYSPFGHEAEAMRTLRSQLKLRWFNDRKTLALVQARAGEGCSNVAANLAISFSQLGEHTLLIDADMRAPSQHRLFGLPAGDGLCNMLNGRSSLANVLTPVPGFPNLSVLCAGATVPNPQELLHRLSFAFTMETLSTSFDVVIVDAPPALEFADAQPIAAGAGAHLFVTRQHATRAADIEAMKERLQPAGSALLGAVMTKA